MPRLEILNPRPARPPASDPVEISGRTLEALRRPDADPDATLDLTAQLRSIDPTAINGDRARIAFWLNVYNSLLLERLADARIEGSMLRHPRLFSRTAYLIGAEAYSLNLIEHGVLRRNRRAPLHARAPFRRGDPRLRSLPSRLDPRIHFALNCGARSCPPIQTYDARALDADLEVATRSYLAAETVVDRGTRSVVLPRLMRLYRGDFGSRTAHLDFAAARVPGLAELIAGDPPPRVRYGQFDWTAVPPEHAGSLLSPVCPAPRR